MKDDSKFLRRALNKLTRFRDGELHGHLTPQEVVRLRNYFCHVRGFNCFPDLAGFYVDVSVGNCRPTTVYLTVGREMAETFPHHPLYYT